ncbi:polyprenyl synthetase family protein [Varunaivibrio sulfuroxidans]|uniref:Farnesyl-diphosphate synthase n=1 Tax=Varunaivibrio sulfuroxidans TaxID=1773489 RepID=A0A4R3J7B2_9PROT|nr:farnesyl diphosphate synthase [Varunaivibrio sulfuroxidans]TCS60350.1 farnesyl-diphosphate synthase [Varunaivibrio sulfuroxidans]WES30963.1 polyprenyl synthetase family protein [Varunaivibrio sulfuroxidans]
MDTFQRAMRSCAHKVEGVLDSLLPPDDGPEGRLMEALRYAALGGGKRVRPFLTLASAAMFNVEESHALRVAAAIEMVHCYSLVHDDLPAMDDDAVRRGRATVHIQFDEATAILAGDALLTQAFEVLADAATHPDAAVRVELVGALAKAAGAFGMVGGQMLDLLAGDRDLALSEITRLQRMKTGMLIAVACEAGGIIGKATEGARHMLHAYAHDLGLAFQIADDLLDVEGDAETVGKKTGKDAQRGKATFVSALGVSRAREQAEMLSRQAVGHLDVFGEKAELLRKLADYVVVRGS